MDDGPYLTDHSARSEAGSAAWMLCHSSLRGYTVQTQDNRQAFFLSFAEFFLFGVLPKRKNGVKGALPRIGTSCRAEWYCPGMHPCPARGNARRGKIPHRCCGTGFGMTNRADFCGSLKPASPARFPGWNQRQNNTIRSDRTARGAAMTDDVILPLKSKRLFRFEKEE